MLEGPAAMVGTAGLGEGGDGERKRSTVSEPSAHFTKKTRRFLDSLLIRKCYVNETPLRKKIAARLRYFLFVHLNNEGLL